MLEEEYETSRRRPPRHLRPPSDAEPTFAFAIRPAEVRDLADIREIYNHYVTNSVVTLDATAWTHAQWRDRFARLTRLGLPFLVAETPSGQIIGYAYVQPWGSARPRHVVESSIYLGPGATGKGLGRALLEALVVACEEHRIGRLVAVVSDKGAEASVALHQRLGFVEVGRMGRIGFKFGRPIGAIHLEKALGASGRRPFDKLRDLVSRPTPGP